ncbi:hypothetical protein EVAR_95374_1 [Eumeta japonica]|uniref:Uncharacterized protein n=1 Tax=Eumeta variegata TaxID=151549 RepID=A0A4C1U956_EUMVA|nr:hypothetical protein EVAR_95374_1 [Eumeta japonica]
MDLSQQFGRNFVLVQPYGRGGGAADHTVRRRRDIKAGSRRPAPVGGVRRPGSVDFQSFDVVFNFIRVIGWDLELKILRSQTRMRYQTSLIVDLPTVLLPAGHARVHQQPPHRRCFNVTSRDRHELISTYDNRIRNRITKCAPAGLRHVRDV